MFRARAFVIFASTLLALAGCSSSSSSGGEEPGGSAGSGTTAPQTYMQSIKASDGGMVMVPGATMQIPPGALSTDTTITVAVSDKSGQPNADSIAAEVFDFGPNGTTFSQPVQLSIDFQGTVPSGKKAVIAFLQNGAWVPLDDSTVTGSSVVAHTTHFTPYTVVFTDSMQASGQCSSFTACGGDLTGTWAIGVGCANIVPQDAPIPNCPGSMISVTVTPTGTITFDATAGTYSLNAFDGAIAMSGTFPTSCAPNGDCTMTKGPSGATYTMSGSTCDMTAMTTFNGGKGPKTESGTVSVTGSQFVTTPTGGSAGTPTPYCVMGTMLQVQIPIGKNGSTVVMTGTKQLPESSRPGPARLPRERGACLFC